MNRNLASPERCSTALGLDSDKLAIVAAYTNPAFKFREGPSGYLDHTPAADSSPFVHGKRQLVAVARVRVGGAGGPR